MMTKKTPPCKVSIIIPVHNTARYLEQCLDSVVRQTLREIEIIIVDDGSTDGSSEIIRRFQEEDPRVTVVANPRPSGNPGTPRNQALEIARGEYLGFVDSDDWVDAEMFQTLYTTAVAFHKPFDVVILDGYWAESGSGRSAKTVDFGRINVNDKHDLFSKYNGLALWDKLFRRGFINEHRLRLAETRISVDVPFVILSLLLAKHVGFAKGSHYHYRQNVNNSTVHLRKQGYYSYITEVYDITKKLMEQHGIDEKYGDIHAYKKINSMLYLLSQIEVDQAKTELTSIIKDALGTMDVRRFFHYLDAIGKPDVMERLFAYGILSRSDVNIVMGQDQPVIAFHQPPHFLGRLSSLMKRIRRFVEKKDNPGNKIKVFFRFLLSLMLSAGYEIRAVSLRILRKIFGRDASRPLYYKPPRSIGVASTERAPRLIVSLTSFPVRINTIHLTIATLLTQDLKPDKLILWLAESQFPGKERDLPGNLLDLMRYGLTIDWCEDLKPYKKLIPSLRQYPGDIIVTTDDDVYYPPNTLKKLYESYVAEGGNIYCLRGRHIKIDENNEIMPYKDWQLVTKYAAASYLNISTGVGGVLYPPQSLHNDVLNKDLFQQLAPINDDLWFWAMAVLNNTKIVILNNDQAYPDYIAGTQGSGLWEMYNQHGEIDEQLAGILSRYPSIKAKLISGGADESRNERLPRKRAR